MAEVLDALTEPISDYRYFKYRAINKHLIESLVNSHLYFSKPEKLNDPFDCQLDLRKSWVRAVSSATGIAKDWLQSAIDNPPFLDEYKHHMENVGVCSFSLDLDRPLSASVLWSHYADEHRGVCLLYRFPESSLLDPENMIIGAAQVNYEDNTLSNWLEKNNAPMMGLMKFLDGLARIYLTTKSPAWQYENESRIIRKQQGLFGIPMGFLEQVCFGLRTPSADIDLVTKLAREHSGCNMFCRIIRDTESDFGIRAVEV